MPRSRRLLGWAVLALALPGCLKLVTAPAPLSDPAASEIDERLCGVWQTEANGGGQLSIARSKAGDDPALLRIVPAEYNRNDGTFRDVGDAVYCSVTRLGDERYLNLFTTRALKPTNLGEPGSYAACSKDRDRVCVIAKYEVEGKRLTLWAGGGEAAVEFDPQDAGSLARYLRATKGQTLFPPDKNKLVYTRVR